MALKGHQKPQYFLKNNLFNRRFDDCNRWSDACTIVDSTLAQPPNQHLCNCRIHTSKVRIEACATVDSALVKKSLFCFILGTKIANINTNLFWKKLFRNIFCSILHTGTSANTAKVMGWQRENLNFKLDQIYDIEFTLASRFIFLVLTQNLCVKII